MYKLYTYFVCKTSLQKVCPLQLRFSVLGTFYILHKWFKERRQSVCFALGFALTTRFCWKFGLLLNSVCNHVGVEQFFFAVEMVWSRSVLVKCWTHRTLRLRSMLTSQIGAPTQQNHLSHLQRTDQSYLCWWPLAIPALVRAGISKRSKGKACQNK